MILEIKGYSYKNKIFNILYINISMQGNLERKGMLYKIYSKKNDNKKQIIYQSEGIKAIKTQKEISFRLLYIPDIYICNDKSYEESQVCISFEDSMHRRHLGEFNGSLALLINNNPTVQLKQDISATINIETIKNYHL